MDLEFKNADEIKGYYNNYISNKHPIFEALNNGKLIVFIGAGMSFHLKKPSWKEFAFNYLDFIYENNLTTLLNFKTKETLKAENTNNPRKLLSICEFAASQNIIPTELKKVFKEWFEVKIGDVQKGKLYEKLYSLNAIFLTTNYDNALDLIVEQPQHDFFGKDKENNRIFHSKEKKVFYKIEEFEKNILVPGNIIHIHGSIKDTENLVVSNEDYIRRYYINIEKSSLLKTKAEEEKIYNYREFLNNVFGTDYVTLFIGYGLEELEILQYLFNYITDKELESTRYLLFPCFADEFLKISYLHDYYKKNYNVSIIPLDMTEYGYDSIEKFLDFICELSKKDISEKTENIDEFNKTLSQIMEL